MQGQNQPDAAAHFATFTGEFQQPVLVHQLTHFLKKLTVVTALNAALRKLTLKLANCQEVNGLALMTWRFHVLDGLLYQESDLEITKHYTDTAGFTEHVFVLMHLPGFAFAPKIRHLHAKRLFIRGKADKYPLAEWRCRLYNLLISVSIKNNLDVQYYPFPKQSLICICICICIEGI